jgi:hypothetical protein
VIDQHHEQVRRKRLFGLDELDLAGLAQGTRQMPHVRLGNAQFDEAAVEMQFLGEIFNDFDGRAFTQIVDIGFVGEAEATDGLDTAGGDAIENFADDLARAAAVDPAGLANEAGLFAQCRHNKPRIDGDAVAADTGPRLQDVDARMMVGKRNQFADVDAAVFADIREFVGEGDVDVAEGVLAELAEFGGARVGDQALAGVTNRS